MIRIANAQLWVHDQEEALAFYTEKVGMEVRADVTLSEMDDFRWLTVGPPGQEDVSIVLMAIPGPPVMDEETAAQVRELMGKGFSGTVFLTSEDCRPPTRSWLPAASSSAKLPKSVPTGSTRAFAILRETASGSPRSACRPRSETSAEMGTAGLEPATSALSRRRSPN
jgi:catechol 2,3-dioxygenase-like lactoylglutathione lyase family enzyme